MSETKLINKFPAGIVNVPPSKSQTHRAIICALLSYGETRLENIIFSRDIVATLNAAAALGGTWQRVGEDAIVIEGIGGTFQNYSAEPVVINCGESGSTLRFMLPIAAALGIPAIFTGEGRLMQRPLEPYEQVFAQHGVTLERTSNGVKISSRLTSGEYRIDGDVSSQFVSGLMFSLSLLDGDSVITSENKLESRAYVDMTIDTLEKFSVHIHNEDYKHFHIRGKQKYQQLIQSFAVEGDYSQAAFFLAAGALGADVECAGLLPDSLQGDKAILDILMFMGAEIVRIQCGTIKVYASELRAVDVDVSQIPDLAPPIAALMCLARGESRIHGAARLRLKESDRITAIAQALSALGADIHEQGDTLVINGKPSLPGGNADAYGDHRIAMMVALAAIRCKGEVTLTGWECVDKSYPSFWDDFEHMQ
ncbi:MAG: 3-phosphoshikimate 1-carboxyvinyltransferase [Defluviitaleaceae bacterium]|nr:3-phosphoshikimate 1-carboxyvinyltransferase [Defluviitaleaceae bacterium]